jgi:hypothetical protein
VLGAGGFGKVTLVRYKGKQQSSTLMRCLTSGSNVSHQQHLKHTRIRLVPALASLWSCPGPLVLLWTSARRRNGLHAALCSLPD